MDQREWNQHVDVAEERDQLRSELDKLRNEMQAKGLLLDLEPIAPVIHLNGSGKKYLLDKYHTALESVSRALECVADAGPHMRDYYSLGESKGRIAIKQHETRILRLRSVHRELNLIFEKLMEHDR